MLFSWLGFILRPPSIPHSTSHPLSVSFVLGSTKTSSERHNADSILEIEMEMKIQCEFNSFRKVQNPIPNSHKEHIFLMYSAEKSFKIFTSRTEMFVYI